MIGFIVSGHGNYATGITSSLNLILGELENYIAVDFPQEDTATELEKNIDNAIESLKVCEKIIIFCDLLSGSPFNVSIMKSMIDERIKVIYGTNLAMLMESIMKRNMGTDYETIVEEVIETGKKQIGVFAVDKNMDDDSFE